MLPNPLIAQAGSDWPITRKLIFGVCLLSFVYQIYRITAHYYRYDTEFHTNLSNGRKQVLDLPAITLCAERDAIYLKPALRKKFPRISKYLDLIDNNLNYTTKQKEQLKNSIYYHFLEQDINFVNYFDRSIQPYDLTECYLNPPTKWLHDKNLDQLFKDCIGSSPVLESKVNLIGQSSETKCFTFLGRQQTVANGITDLQVYMKDLEHLKLFESTILQMIVIMDGFKDSVPMSSFERFRQMKTNTSEQSVYLFIHDPYGMPSFDTMDAIKLKAGKRYDIRLSPTSKSLLKHPFPSDCYDYHNNFNKDSSKYKSRDQCIHNCYLKKSKEQLKCLFPYYLPYLSNNDLLRTNNFRHCSYDDPLYKTRDFLKQCQQQCQQDCHRTEYKFDYKEMDHSRQSIETPLQRKTKTFSLVKLLYKKDSEVEYKERPVQSKCDTIQMMFIWLLIWFGISIFSFSSVFERAVNRAKPHMYYISTFEDKVSPSVVSVHTPNNTGPAIGWPVITSAVQTNQPIVRPKVFTPTKIGSNLKLDHYNEFISKVVEGCPTAPTVELPQKKPLTQY